MKTKLIDARPHHCGQIARRLRPEHGDVLARMGVSAHADLRARFDASPIYRKAWMVDGRLMAIGGLEASMADSDGFVWLALAEGMPPISFARMALREFEKLFHVKHQLSTFILKDDRPSLMLARRMGFHVENTEQRNGAIVLTMVARKIRKAA